MALKAAIMASWYCAMARSAAATRSFISLAPTSCSGQKWKGEVTSQEHTPTLATRPFARKVGTIGFSGTYTDDGAENDNTALLGKQSVRFKTILRLLIPD